MKNIILVFSGFLLVSGFSSEVIPATPSCADTMETELRHCSDGHAACIWGCENSTNTNPCGEDLPPLNGGACADVCDGWKSQCDEGAEDRFAVCMGDL
jgi:hypothetical protein